MKDENQKNFYQCGKTSYRQLYQEYATRSYFGGMEDLFLEPQTVAERNQLVDTGYRVNKTIDQIIHWQTAKSSYHFQVFDHIRLVEEILAGIFISEDDEFNLIFPQFIKEFMMHEVYVIYSEEAKKLELSLAVNLALQQNEDPYEWIERSCPNSNYRLYRRVRNSDNKPQWDAVLSGVQNVNLEGLIGDINSINSELGEGEKASLPIRFTYNEGFMFIRLFHIFQRYEAQLQAYYSLFQTLHTVMDISGETDGAIKSRVRQLLSNSVYTSSFTEDIKNATTAEKLELVSEMTNLTESYHNITTLLNDDLTRLGLGGDDSTKCERITTGENFRALQPNMAFQQSVMHKLDIVSQRLKIHFKRNVKFINTLTPNEQGIPMQETQPNKKKKVNKRNEN